jgi:hypothetical protein
MTEVLKVSKEVSVNIALAMYLGEQCKYCGKVYETLDDLKDTVYDLKDTVYAGYHEHGHLACQSCWSANNAG